MEHRLPFERDEQMHIQPSATPPPASKPSLLRFDLWLFGIIAVAFVLRLLWALHVEVDPRTYWRWDMTIYDYQAYALAKGQGFVDFAGLPTAHWPPGYPALLAPLYRLTDNSLLSARLLNVVAGTATVFLAYLLGAKAFNRRAGLLGAALLAFFPGQIFATSLVMTEVVFTFLFVLALTVAVHTLFGDGGGRLWQAFLVGVLVGAATLVRGEGLLLVAIVPALLLFRQRSRRVALARSSLLVVGAAAVVLPWTARNVVEMHAPIIISTSATEALWVGHHEGANGRIADFTVPEQFAGMPNPDYEVKTNNEALKEALRFVKGHPVEEVRLIPRRFVALYAGDGAPIAWHDNPSTLSIDKAKWLGRLSDWYYWPIGGIAALGLPVWLSLRDRRKALLAAVVGCWTLLFSVVFFGDERFHLAIIPIFCLWAAVSLTAVWQIARSRLRPPRAESQGEASVEERGAAVTVERHCGGEKAP
jgi:4-amino-4-deoxy-L-arabinose transferase-like glycosyltransferase